MGNYTQRALCTNQAQIRHITRRLPSHFVSAYARAVVLVRQSKRVILKKALKATNIKKLQWITHGGAREEVRETSKEGVLVFILRFYLEEKRTLATP